MLAKFEIFLLTKVQGTSTYDFLLLNMTRELRQYGFIASILATLDRLTNVTVMSGVIFALVNGVYCYFPFYFVDYNKAYVNRCYFDDI